MRGADGTVKPFELGGETSSEDCEPFPINQRSRRLDSVNASRTEGLSVNVIKPAHVGPNAKLPVVFVRLSTIHV